MQKKLIALAVATLAAGSAFAQSNVTVYGRLNHVIESTSAGTPTGGLGNDAFNTAKQRVRMTDNSSALGFKGVEDLGGGLKAWFQIESSANMTDGAALGIGSRNSGVGLRGNWGEVMYGSWDAYYFDQGRATGYGLFWGAGASDLAILNGVNGSSSVFSFAPTRMRNQVRYTTPNLSGFTAYVAYGAGNNNLLDANGENKITATGADEQTWVLNATYNNGPIFGSASWFKTSDAAGTNNGNPVDGSTREGWKVAGSYDFAFGTHIGATYEKLQGKQAGGINVRRNAWVINLGQKIGANQNINLFYGVSGDAKGTGAFVTGGLGNFVPGADTGAKWVALQYDYALSKRTVLYTGYAKLSNEAAATQTTWGGLTASAGQDPKTFWVGASHAF